MPMRSFHAVTRLLPLALGAFLGASPALAQTAKVDRVRAFLIWEDSGDLSKNVVGQTPRIEANTQKGMSTQIMIDIVVSGPKNKTAGKNVMLYTWANNDQDKGARPMMDLGWPVTYFGDKGETVRSVIINHDCQPFTLSARVDHGDKIGRVFEKTFPIFCGD